MQILTVDIGTGTQDIFLYDSRLDLENGYKLVLPSPTMIVNHQLREATRRGQAVLLHGVTMGGGPSQWAAEAHIRSGLRIYATPEAARTFNDELEAVQAMGVLIVSEDEAEHLPEIVLRIELKDFDFESITAALGLFGVSLRDLKVVVVAVFDHGNAPPGYSDRQFRFDYLDQRIRAQNRLSAFAYRAESVPPILTRLQAVATSARQNILLHSMPLVVMDTAPAAILGALHDPAVSTRERILVVNVGNFHTLAFRLGPGGIEGVFEHHTGLLDRPKLEILLRTLADGSLKHSEVFNDHGHGALVYDPTPLRLEDGDFGVAVTGPRRNLLRASTLRPYFAVPFGDMMITGCFGLLAATAEVLLETGVDPREHLHPVAAAIRASLSGFRSSGASPWELD